MLRHGSFTWSIKVTPSDFSESRISSKDKINNDTLYKGILLDYSMEHEISNESIKKWTKIQVLSLPTLNQ